MGNLFNGCSSLGSLPDISKWNTKNVTNMEYMFNGCSSLVSLPDISKWNIKNIKDMSNMFFGCFSLSSFPNLSKWNINEYDFKVNLKGMYTNCFSVFFKPSHYRTYKLNRSKNKNIINNNIQRKHSFDHIYKMQIEEKRKEIEKTKTKEEIIIENQEKKINNYLNRIIKLEGDLAEQKKSNDTINNKINDVKNLRERNDLMILELEEKKNNNEKELLSLQNQLDKLNEKYINQNYYGSKPLFDEQINYKNEIYLNVNFASTDFEIFYSIPCKNSDLISRLEEELCIKYAQYKEYNTILTLEGKNINRFMTVEENGIQNEDTIIFKIYE